MKLTLEVSSWVLAILSLSGLAISAHAFGVEVPHGQGSEVTNTDVLMLISYVLLALVFSFLCSVAEAVLLSMTPSYIEGKREKQPKRAALFKKLKQDNVDQSLAAILTLTPLHIRLVRLAPEPKRQLYLEAPGLVYSRV